MADFSVVQNEKLRALLKASIKFNSLTQEKQGKYLERIKKISPEKQEKFYEAFKKIDEKPFSATDSAINNPPLSQEKLEQLYSDFTALTQKFKNLLSQESERKERKTETEEMDKLLDEINKM